MSDQPLRTVARGWGHALPRRAVDNHTLAQTLDTSDEWIVQRTGIRQRHVAEADETTSHLAAAAGAHALAQAGLEADALDLIVVATATPDCTFPSTACLVQAALGNTRAAAFDVSAACSGFLYGLSVVDALLRSGGHRRCLLIGAETFSRILDWSDRNTAVLFGDGAGAVVLETSDASPKQEPGLLSTHLFSDGRYSDKLKTSGGPGSTGDSGRVQMEGREVYRHGIVRMAEAVACALEHNGLTADDVQWFVPHQANLRMLESMADRLSIPRARMLVGVDRHANTSAASIPLVISEAAAAGKFAHGDLLLLEALGAGFTWASAALCWNAHGAHP